ncbi:protein of unassigned function [Methylobacterium oryzae CBMB20]|uniref:Protein of unassigned function n=1 Tax=Methylobacterium oryzae CBMB20 TaxID=693986 RepID=A0A089P3P9_9HYPH|nr:protein of unassigned function [Methylobacterium oryzae CBMB20]
MTTSCHAINFNLYYRYLAAMSRDIFDIQARQASRRRRAARANGNRGVLVAMDQF